MADLAQLFAARAGRMRASEIRELLKLLDQPDIISFAGGIPDPALFPTAAFAEAYGALLCGQQAAAALQYAPSEGHAPLRDWIAARLAADGIACDRDNILVTSGSQQALDYLGKLFLSPGGSVLVARPTYLGALQALNAYEPAYQTLTPDGGNTTPQRFRAAAAAAGGRAKLAYVTPDFANPTGHTLDRAGRRRLLDLAETLDLAVVEDTAYRALRYDGAPVASLLALELAGGRTLETARTIQCGSFSKTLSPGLRLGWICAAKPVVRQLVLMKQAADLHTPTINQMAMHHVAERLFDDQVATLRDAYRARRDAMLDALARHMPAGVEWTRPEGGMFVWLALPAGLDAARLLERAVAEARVAFVPGRAFHADGGGADTLRLSFSCADPAAIETGIARLGRLIAGRAG
ncbi:PLP-dependent aminotransferase family protein [Aquibium sp. A9E412]|uniref:aminotransferase-like domain-containing protein n=1 Tax=Aquibium sp. A9E412 TaxID=2976767 RepID=UPI0025B1ABA4|nr:PLP-dependent aminotransferase family protein [Aquibium sp. A9E412]MDN2566498.1 PLP-dependent aminotransferase family protein [Aquibium sp. A9E412]